MKTLEIRARPAATALLLALWCAAPALAEKGHVSSSDWWPQVEKVEKAVRAQSWKSARRQAHKLAEEVLGRSWYGRELRQILAELAFYQAIAEANLGLRREAVWHWHMAQNLDFKMRQRDLTPYGEGAELLIELPLRQLHEIPAGFEVSGPGAATRPPVMPRMTSSPEIINNTGAALESPGDCDVELLIDELGELHHPVIISTHLHPVVIYEVLDYLPELDIEPARAKGQPTDSLFRLSIKFHVVRW